MRLYFVWHSPKFRRTGTVAAPSLAHAAQGALLPHRAQRRHAGAHALHASRTRSHASHSWDFLINLTLAGCSRCRWANMMQACRATGVGERWRRDTLTMTPTTTTNKFFWMCVRAWMCELVAVDAESGGVRRRTLIDFASETD